MKIFRQEIYPAMLRIEINMVSYFNISRFSGNNTFDIYDN